MRITVITILLSAFCTSFAMCQKLGKGNSLQLSYNAPYYLSRFNIENDNKQPNPLSTRNTLGSTFGLGYQHVFRSGLTINAMVQWGKQTHEINVDYDLSSFDPAAVTSLKGVKYHQQYGMAAWFLTKSFMMGYIHALPFARKGWYIESRAGLGFKAYNNRIRPDYDGRIITYKLDDEPVFKARYFYTSDALIGNDKLNLSPIRNHNNVTMSFEGYVGLKKDIKKRWLKSIYSGLTYTRALARNRAYSQFLIRSYDSDTELIGLDFYYDKNISVGIVIGVGFWF